MGSIRRTAVHLIRNSGGWRRWVVSFLLVGLAIAATFLLVAAFFPGETFLERLAAAYKVLWQNTTRRQFTDIMRENPWLLVVPGGTLVFVSGLLLPLNSWGRAGVVYLAFSIGVVFGHVFG